MKTEKLTKTRSSSRQPHSSRLNLLKSEVSRMLSKLHSYRCEPCTPAMHEQYLELNYSGHKLKQAVDEMELSIQDSAVRFSIEMGDEINGITKKYDNFQKKFSSYLTESVLHH